MLVSRKRNYDFSDILDDQYTFELTEQDFYFQTDDRVLKSYVEDIENVKALGVKIETNVIIGKSVTIDELLEEEGYYE